MRSHAVLYRRAYTGNSPQTSARPLQMPNGSRMHRHRNQLQPKLSWLCLFVVKLSAQSAYPEDAVALDARRRWSLIILEHSLDPINGSMIPASPRAYERSVVSVQRLQHRPDKRARKLSDKGMRDFFRNRVTEALPPLQHAVALDPHSSVLENDLGVVYCVLGRDKGSPP